MVRSKVGGVRPSEGTIEYRRYRIGACQVDMILSSERVGVEWLDARPARGVAAEAAPICATLGARLRVSAGVATTPEVSAPL
jgi:hypothetical protein